MDSCARDAHVIRFGVFELDAQSRERRRHGLKIRLPDQPLQILKTPVGRPALIDAPILSSENRVKATSLAEGGSHGAMCSQALKAGSRKLTADELMS